jgi:hypothetical protein
MLPPAELHALKDILPGKRVHLAHFSDNDTEILVNPSRKLADLLT